MNQPLFGFSFSVNGRLRDIITEIGISIPFVTGSIKKDDSRISRTRALWDTGASGCFITKAKANELGLKPVRFVDVHHGGGTTPKSPMYLVNLYLPNDVVIPGVRMIECIDKVGNFEVIIGMDIIGLGDFAINFYNGVTTVSYRIPAPAHLDVNKVNVSPDTTTVEKNRLDKPHAKIGRNDPCYCGSNKKYKHCHGANS